MQGSKSDFESLGNRVIGIGAKQPDIVLLRQDLLVSGRLPSRRNGPEVDAHDPQGEERPEDCHCPLLHPAHHQDRRRIVRQGQRQIVHAKMPNNPAGVWAIFAAHASVIALAKVDQAWEDTGHADAGSAGSIGSTTWT